VSSWAASEASWKNQKKTTTTTPKQTHVKKTLKENIYKKTKHGLVILGGLGD